MVGLHVRLEDGADRCTEAPCLVDVFVHELGVRIDDRELVVREAAEQVARARRGRKENGRKTMLASRYDACLLSNKANLPIPSIAVADTSLSLLWDTTRLRLLVEIERQGTVSAAARSVGIGQPTASEHLRLLEAAAGQRLVERNGRGSRLTEAGSLLAARAREALAALHAGEEELGALAGLEAGTIHIGASTTPGVYLLPDTLGCFRRDHPHVDVEVEIASTDEMIERLLAGRVQLALVGETEVDDRVELTPFLADEIIGIAKPGLLPIKGGRIKAEALADQTLLVREAGSSTRQTAERALAQAGVRPKRRVGARLERGDQARSPRRPRRCLPLALCSRRGDRARRTRRASVCVERQKSSDACMWHGLLAARSARASEASSQRSPAAVPRTLSSRPPA